MNALREWSVDIYNRSRIGLYLASKELDYITRILSQKSGVSTILDVGCGSGKLAIPLYDRGYKVIGLDNDELPLRWFRKNSRAITVVMGDVLDLPFDSGSFDCIMAIELIDAIENRGRSYAEVLRVLKPGGLFILQMSNKRSIKGLVYELYLKIKKRDRTAGDLENYRRDYKQQAGEIKRAGFRIIDAKGYNWNLIPRNSDSRLIRLWESLEVILRLQKLPALSPLVLTTAIKESRN
jgi:SAM-dependent methyltransferase